MPLRIVCSFLALISLAFAGTFDKPVSKKVVDLGPSPFYPPRPNPEDQIRVKVTCYYFPSFMVKEFDEGEKGAERLAIVPGAIISAPCVRGRSRNEEVISPKKWSGYFKGVKGHFVFFNASDGWNGGMPFVVYHAQIIKKVFGDNALGELELSETQPLTLKYMRVVDSECNLMKESSACWTAVQKRFHLEGFTAPDCKAGYERYARAFVDRCPSPTDSQCQEQEKELALRLEGLSSTDSAIAYPVQVTLGANPTIKPVAGNIQCRPVD